METTATYKPFDLAFDFDKTFDNVLFILVYPLFFLWVNLYLLYAIIYNNYKIYQFRTKYNYSQLTDIHQQIKTELASLSCNCYGCRNVRKLYKKMNTMLENKKKEENELLALYSESLSDVAQHQKDKNVDNYKPKELKKYFEYELQHR